MSVFLSIGSPRRRVASRRLSECTTSSTTDSCTSSPDAEISRASAGTWSPVSSSMRSPGTSNRAGINVVWPSRTARASGAERRSSEASALSACSSCRKPMIALTSTIAMMAAASAQSPSMPETMAAAIRIQITSS